MRIYSYSRIYNLVRVQDDYSGILLPAVEAVEVVDGDVDAVVLG